MSPCCCFSSSSHSTDPFDSGVNTSSSSSTNLLVSSCSWDFKLLLAHKLFLLPVLPLITSAVRCQFSISQILISSLAHLNHVVE